MEGEAVVENLFTRASDNPLVTFAPSAETSVGNIAHPEGHEHEQCESEDSHDPPEKPEIFLTAIDGTFPVGVDLTGADISSKSREQLEIILRHFEMCFSHNRADIGLSTLVEHSIPLVDNAVPPCIIRKVPFHLRDTFRAEVNKLKEAGIVKPCSSPFLSPAVLVNKSDGTLRLVVDFCELNKITKIEKFPIPRLEEMLELMGNNPFRTSFDATQAFYNIPMNKMDEPKTAFCALDETLNFARMPMGLSGSPSTLQRLMNHILLGLL